MNKTLTTQGYFKRRIFDDIISHLDDKEITVITGMRRVGKTTLVKHVMETIESKNKIYFDLEKITNREIFEEKNYDNVLSILKSEYNLSKEEKLYIILDEIQLSPNLPSVLKYLVDNYDIKFIVTGSSSFYIKNLFTESLAGRKKIFELYPLDFGEFLVFKGLKKDFEDTKEIFEIEFIQKLRYENYKTQYEEYVMYGGFPSVVFAESIKDKKSKLLDIVNSYVNLDIKSIASFKDDRETYQLMKILSARVGSKIEYSKISSVTGLSTSDVRNYLDFFEDTYLIHRISVHTNNIDKEIVKAQKLYFSDTGILGTLSDLDSGSIFENALYNQLKKYGEIQYFSLKNGKEIDFIVEYDHKKIAIECKETPIYDDFSNLEKMSKLAGVSKCLVIGKNLSPSFDKYVWGGDVV